jgi:hypothetical protein
MRKALLLTLSVVFAGGCALYSDVSIAPLHLMPGNIERGSDVHSMLRKADYLRAIELTSKIEAQERQDASHLAALGTAHLTAGRYDEARRLLRAAIDLRPFRTRHAEIAWELSQVEYLSNNMESSLEWAEIARQHGLQIKPWHVSYLRSLVGIPIYSFAGSDSAKLPLRFGKPDVPRVNATVNGSSVEAIIDSGAVLSIISERMADEVGVERLGETVGTFYGLLGEPIPVRFGIIRSLDLGAMTVAHVPVAIMPDVKMRFLLSKREGTQFHMDFLLGSHFLKEFRLELNFDRNHAVFTRLTAPDRQPADDQNLFIYGFRPYVRSVVNRQGWHLFVLDTGSEITFLNESSIGNLPVVMYGAVHGATLQGLGGAMKRGSKLERVEIGVDRWAGTFKTLPMYSSGDETFAAGIIGQNFLMNFNVVLDFGRMRLDLERR